MGSDYEKKLILKQIESNVPINKHFSNEELDYLASFSKDEDEEIRCKTAEILCDLTDERGEEILRGMVFDKDSLVRTEACDSLGSGKSLQSYELLKRKAASDPHGMVRGYAVLSLCDIAEKINKQEDAKAFLLSRINKEKVVFTRIDIYETLYRLTAEDEYLQQLIAYLNTKNYRNRCAAANCLDNIANDGNRETIVAALKARQKEHEPSRAVTSTIDKIISKLT